MLTALLEPGAALVKETTRDDWPYQRPWRDQGCMLPELTKWSIILRQVYMVCVHPRPFLKPNWLSPVLRVYWNLS